VCRPSDHALDAFAALEYLWENRYDTQAPKLRLEPRVVQAARRLEEKQKQRYQFMGGQNQRGGFVVLAPEEEQ
jgi:hypothetical protein